MNSTKYVALFLVLSVLSTDFLIPVVLAGHHHRNNQGIELLLAAGILAKLLRKKGHHHHHHGHHHHGSGSRNVEEYHVAPPMSGYSQAYPPAPQGPSYADASRGSATTTSFSASVEYPYGHHPMASHPMQQAVPVTYGGGPHASAATFIGYQPQPMQMYPAPMAVPVQMVQHA